MSPTPIAVVLTQSPTELYKILKFEGLSASGAEAKHVLDILHGLNEEEWKADRLARSLSRDIYRLEDQVDPITIIFYEKMLLTLGAIANEAENAGDMLRTMIVK